MDYIIVKSSNMECNDGNEIKSLEEKVRDQMNEGYVPLGGVAVRIGQSSGAYFLQAMIRGKNG